MLLYVLFVFQLVFLIKADQDRPSCDTYYGDVLSCYNAGNDGKTIAQLLQNLPLQNSNKTFVELAPALERVEFRRGRSDFVFEQNFFDAMRNLKDLAIESEESKVLPVRRLKIPSRAFANTRKLYRLKIQNFLWDEETIQAFRSVKDKVNEIVLDQNLPASRILSIVSEFTNLTHAGIHGMFDGQSFSPEIYKGSLSKIYSIVVSNSNTPKITKQTFPNLPKLTYLRIYSCNVSSFDVDAFDNLSTLEWLEVRYNRLQGLPDGLFSKLKKLKNVVFEDDGDMGNLSRDNFTHVDNFDRFTFKIEDKYKDIERRFRG